ncbi:MAG: hypothetical protein V4689_11730 [Verrucomicrobiota bacterium]
MTSKKIPGSIASEAARLTIELGSLVTPDKIRWWRKKGYPLDDIPALKKRLGNQERQSKATTKPADPETPSFAYRLITDEMVKKAKGTIPVGVVLDYLRDQWEAEEWHRSATLAGNSVEDREKTVRQNIAFKYWTLQDLLPVSLPRPEWLREMLFPKGES